MTPDHLVVFWELIPLCLAATPANGTDIYQAWSELNKISPVMQKELGLKII